MNTVDDWATRLAGAVDPDEADLAPAMTAAYIQGGPARKQLFARDKAALGGFAAEHVTVLLPYVLSGISATATILTAVLTSPHLESSLGIVHHALGILGERKAGAEGATAVGIGALLLGRHKDSPDSPATKQAPPAPDSQPITQVAARISAELVSQGIKQDKADAVAFRVLLKMLEAPESAAQFVSAVAAKS